MKKKEFFLVSLFIVSVLIVYTLFPVEGIFQQVVVMYGFFGAVPILFNKFILKNNFNVFGFKIGNWKQGLVFGGLSLFISSILFFLGIYFFDFFRKRGVPETIVFNFKNFLFYETILVLPVIFVYDLFFRGFMVSTLKTKLSHRVIVLQAVLFFGLVFGSNSFSSSIMPFLINAPLAGWVAYKSESILYSTLFQFIALIILDASMIFLIK